MYLAYCVGPATAAPSSGYTQIPEVKTMPSFNPTPDTIESTTLLETEYKTYVPALKDLGGALEFGANLTEDLIALWGSVNTAFGSMASTSAMWWTVVHPKLTKAVFFQGEPSPLGLNEASVGSMAETTLYVTPSSAPAWGDKATLST